MVFRGGEEEGRARGASPGTAARPIQNHTPPPSPPVLPAGLELEQPGTGLRGAVLQGPQVVNRPTQLPYSTTAVHCNCRTVQLLYSRSGNKGWGGGAAAAAAAVHGGSGGLCAGLDRWWWSDRGRTKGRRGPWKIWRSVFFTPCVGGRAHAHARVHMQKCRTACEVGACMGYVHWNNMYGVPQSAHRMVSSSTNKELPAAGRREELRKC